MQLRGPSCEAFPRRTGDWIDPATIQTRGGWCMGHCWSCAANRWAHLVRQRPVSMSSPPSCWLAPSIIFGAWLESFCFPPPSALAVRKTCHDRQLTCYVRDSHPEGVSGAYLPISCHVLVQAEETTAWLCRTSDLLVQHDWPKRGSRESSGPALMRRQCHNATPNGQGPTAATSPNLLTNELTDSLACRPFGSLVVRAVPCRVCVGADAKKSLEIENKARGSR